MKIDNNIRDANKPEIGRCIIIEMQRSLCEIRIKMTLGQNIYLYIYICMKPLSLANIRHLIYIMNDKSRNKVQCNENIDFSYAIDIFTISNKY